MGFGRSLKRVSRAVQKAVRQTVTNVRHLPEFATELGQIGAAPINFAAGSIGGALSAAEPVLAQATGILAANPLLGQALGAATGLPIGGLFSGPVASDGGGSGGGSIVTPFAPAAAAEPAATGIPMWVWIAGGGAALLGLVLFLRRRKD